VIVIKVKQIATILNTIINQEQIGESVVVKEDLSNIVDVGTEILNYTDESKENYDTVTKSLIDLVGKQIFVDRKYVSQSPNILKDSWEYGSVLEKVRCELPNAEDNATWELGNYPLTDGDNYPDPFELSIPKVDAKFFNGKVAFEVPITIADKQFKESLTSATAMNKFIAMIENRVLMKMTLSTDSLVMRTINNLIAEKINAKNNIVNLLSLYKTETGDTTITATNAMSNANFLRYATKVILLYRRYIQEASMLYNDGGYVTFTPSDRMKFVVLSEFSKSLETSLYSDTYHNEFVKINGYEEVGYWQGTGTTSDERSKINVTIKTATGTADVSQSGVVAVLFDEWGAMVCNENFRVTTQYNPRGEYTNYFYKWDSHYLNDTNENCIVFVIADSE
jgi:hypothetical protein